eukprot:2205384-Prymnesium_polylepis.1
MPGQSCDPRHPSRAIESRCSTTLVPFDHPTHVRVGGAPFRENLSYERSGRVDALAVYSCPPPFS